MTARLVAACLAALLVTSACTSSASAPPPGPLPTNPNRTELIRAAKLAPCPPSTADETAGGLPGVTLPCLGDGPSVHMSGLRGMPSVVNIWGSWCGPCQQEETHLATVYNAVKSRVRFLGVDTVDDPDSALDFDAHVTPPVHYPSVVDAEKTVLLALGGSLGPPITLFVNASGRIVHKKFGPYLSAAALRADIARYLGVSA